MRRLIVPFALLISTLFACSEATTPPSGSVEPESRSQANVTQPSNFHVGQGIDDRIDPQSSTSRAVNFCTDGYVQLEPGGNSEEPAWKTRSFYSSSELDIERRSRSEFGAEFSGPVIGAKLKHTASESGDFDRNEFLLHVAVRVWKATRSFIPEPTTDPTHESICENGTQFSNFSNFADNCGTGYTDSQELGGWMLLTMKVKTEDGEVKQDIGTEIGINLGENTNIGFSNVKETLTGYSGDISQIYMNTAGLMEPMNITAIDQSDETSADSGVYTVSLQDVVDYQNAVNNRVEQALQQEDPHHSDLGVVLDATRKRYLNSQLDACGLNSSQNGQAYQCATSSFATAGRFKDSTDKLSQFLARITDYTDHDEDYTWGGDIQQTQNELDELKNRIIECRDQDIPNLTRGCATVVRNNDIGNFCNECRVGTKCDIDRIQTRFSSLTDGIRRDRGIAEHVTHATRGDTFVSHSAGRNTSLCAIQKVSGKFSTDNDGVKLRHNSTYGNWRLTVSEEGGGSRDQMYRHSSRMGCVGHNEFHDASRTSDPTVPNPNFTLDHMMTSPNQRAFHDTSSRSETLSNNQKMASPISQYNGTSDGLGEWVKTSPAPDTGTGDGYIETNSEAQYSPTDYGIDGSAFTFGFPNSDRGAGGPMSNPYNVAMNGKEERLIGEAGKVFCYLTKVSGEFDGGGEKASVYTDEYHWYLEVDSVCHKVGKRKRSPNDCDNKEIKATARCYYYDHG